MRLPELGCSLAPTLCTMESNSLCVRESVSVIKWPHILLIIGCSTASRRAARKGAVLSKKLTLLRFGPKELEELRHYRGRAPKVFLPYILCVPGRKLERLDASKELTTPFFGRFQMVLLPKKIECRWTKTVTIFWSQVNWGVGKLQQLNTKGTHS